MFGLLNIDKPAGITSRDVVNRVQRVVRPIKCGHAGTLDPLATGVLVVGLGQATRLVEYVQRLPKTYLATFLLGRSSDTEDTTGKVLEVANPSVPSPEQLAAALPRFIGNIEQLPPAYSALKVDGKRAYALARRGEAVELQPRLIDVHRIEIVAYDYPQLTLLIHCGSGTYIRSLGRDIARSVATEAVMSALIRQAIGPFEIGRAIAYEELSAQTIADHLQPPIIALGDMPRIEVTAPEQRRLINGLSIADRWDLKSHEVAALNSAGELIAIVVPTGAGELTTEKCFPLGLG